ncbi:E3 ubiquitin-protein ligase TRIM33-like [Mercenaria mercenaria]|uniref:E3 ubiquitin-protein ligase TRIM33-like n=1 Tax=Mercenaria mercenaria TaxID=6596 RepID=UPI00234E8AC0|nr:E3 ubiquitin-protein ligase TRIM33-like [Mercenaria mercenaria]
MAEGGQATESRTVTETCKQTCSICLDIFRKPHTLPCDHKFCALCLIGYLQKCLNTEGKDIFPCPLCRSEIRVSNYRKVKNEDVTKLDLLSFSQISVENESRKEFNDSCEPCKRGKDNVKATNFCSDCNESLCAGCVTHHLRNKLTCRHVVTNLEDRENKANTIPLDKEYHLKTKCNLHNMKKMKYICIDHDILCCSKCVISDHRKCLDIQSVSDFRKSSQCDEMVQEIKRLFESIYKSIYVITDVALCSRTCDITSPKRTAQCDN